MAIDFVTVLQLQHGSIKTYPNNAVLSYQKEKNLSFSLVFPLYYVLPRPPLFSWKCKCICFADAIYSGKSLLESWVTTFLLN